MEVILMPSKPMRPCGKTGCRELTDSGYCPEHKRQREQQADQQRGTAAERGYNSRWRKARKTYLQRHPLCVHCEQEGLVVEATVIDHIIPHKGDQALFWDTDNWQPLCKRHHDMKTVREDGGFGR
jgi:5-methylcytosine-specific restriction protein A